MTKHFAFTAALCAALAAPAASGSSFPKLKPSPSIGVRNDSGAPPIAGPGQPPAVSTAAAEGAPPEAEEAP